jgi:hypothetical protein
MSNVHIDDNYDKRTILFDLDPFVSDVVLWIDADIIEKRPEFNGIEPAKRVKCVCEKLVPHGIAVINRSPDVMWLPSATVLTECVRSDIVPCSRFYCSTAEPDPQDWRRYEKAVDKQLRRRLGYIVRNTVLVFQCINAGLLKIEGRDGIGMVNWTLCDADLRT